MSDELDDLSEPVLEVVMHACELCGLTQPEPFEEKNYCDCCTERLRQAHQWLQSPMVSATEMKNLQKRILDLTDIKNVRFE